MAVNPQLGELIRTDLEAHRDVMGTYYDGRRAELDAAMGSNFASMQATATQERELFNLVDNAVSMLPKVKTNYPVEFVVADPVDAVNVENSVTRFEKTEGYYYLLGTCAIKASALPSKIAATNILLWPAHGVESADARQVWYRSKNPLYPVIASVVEADFLHVQAVKDENVVPYNQAELDERFESIDGKLHLHADSIHGMFPRLETWKHFAYKDKITNEESNHKTATMRLTKGNEIKHLTGLLSPDDFKSLDIECFMNDLMTLFGKTDMFSQMLNAAETPALPIPPVTL